MYNQFPNMPRHSTQINSRRTRERRHTFRPVPYAEIIEAAQPYIIEIARNVAPDGKVCGHEWVALNPTRHDRHPGSFRINFWTGCWADFATRDRGGDVISYVAYCLGRPNW